MREYRALWGEDLPGILVIFKEGQGFPGWMVPTTGHETFQKTHLRPRMRVSYWLVLQEAS